MNAAEKKDLFRQCGDPLPVADLAATMNDRVVRGAGSTAGVPQIQVQGPEAVVLGVLAHFKGLIDMVEDLEVRFAEIDWAETRSDGSLVRPWAREGDVSMTLLPFCPEGKPKQKTLADWAVDELEAEVARRKAS
jgi:hypothetical protein